MVNSFGHAMNVSVSALLIDARKPEEQLQKPFRYSSYGFLLNTLAISGAYSPERERKRSALVFNVICLACLAFFAGRHVQLVGESWPETLPLRLICRGAPKKRSYLVHFPRTTGVC